MPPKCDTSSYTLKSPAAIHERTRSLGGVRTESFLKHRMGSRPQRSELVRTHVLQEIAAEPSLPATPMKLKRARLANNLNEKIALRPGPMELVEKNILPVDSSVKEAFIAGQVNYSKTQEVEVYDEDSSDVLSPDQLVGKESRVSAASPGDPKHNEISSVQHSPVNSAVDLKSISTNDKLPSCPSASHQPKSAAVTKTSPTLVKNLKLFPEKTRSKKSKESRPRVKKFKYHQYVPPDQKQEASKACMDSAYSRLLQQQQLFLQLQILSQQQQCGHQSILPAPLKRAGEGQAAVPGSTAGPAQSNTKNWTLSICLLPSNLEEMKVAELKLELKLRGLHVSGTKADLIERLKQHQESSACTDTSQQEPGESRSSSHSPQPEDKQRCLHEKERQIQVLRRRLEHQQKLVETLKLQLEVEKREPQSAAVKEETALPPACVGSSGMKQEEMQNCLSAQPGSAQILLPVSLSDTAASVPLQSPGPCVTPESSTSAELTTSPTPPTFILQPSVFTIPKSRDPPRYEEAVKQMRSQQTSKQVTSQQMDDLFDILIDSGEVSPTLHQEPLSLLPVTANVATLPVNTVLSRPLPQVLMAPPTSQTFPGQLTFDPLESHVAALLEEVGLVNELGSHSPTNTEATPPGFDMTDVGLDSMEWLDVTSLGPAAIAADFLDVHWD